MKSALNSAQSYEARFQFFLLNFFLLQIKVKKKQYFWKKNSVGRSSIIRIIRRKFKIWLHNFVRTLMQIPNLSFFVLALIVFDFYSIEISKVNNQKNLKILIFSKTIPKFKKISRTNFFFFFFF